MKYVLGFLFGQHGDVVALIRKTKPEWQAGKLNGIGGKVEPGEESMSAMIREFNEETDVLVTDWHPVATMVFPGEVTVEVFATEFNGILPPLRRPTDEVPQYFPTSEVPYREDIIDNLRWLLPMAYWVLTEQRGHRGKNGVDIVFKY